MSGPTWPWTSGHLALNYPTSGNNYQAVPDDGVVESTMDIGPTKGRRRNTADFDRISFTLPVVTDAEYAQLKAFWITTCKKVLPFTMVDPEAHGMATATFTFARSGALKKTALGGGAWSVQVQLVRQP